MFHLPTQTHELLLKWLTVVLTMINVMHLIHLPSERLVSNVQPAGVNAPFTPAPGSPLELDSCSHSRLLLLLILSGISISPLMSEAQYVSAAIIRLSKKSMDRFSELSEDCACVDALLGVGLCNSQIFVFIAFKIGIFID